MPLNQLKLMFLMENDRQENISEKSDEGCATRAF